MMSWGNNFSAVLSYVTGDPAPKAGDWGRKFSSYDFAKLCATFKQEKTAFQKDVAYQLEHYQPDALVAGSQGKAVTLAKAYYDQFIKPARDVVKYKDKLDELGRQQQKPRIIKFTLIAKQVYALRACRPLIPCDGYDPVAVAKHFNTMLDQVPLDAVMDVFGSYIISLVATRKKPYKSTDPVGVLTRHLQHYVDEYAGAIEGIDRERCDKLSALKMLLQPSPQKLKPPRKLGPGSEAYRKRSMELFEEREIKLNAREATFLAQEAALLFGYLMGGLEEGDTVKATVGRFAGAEHRVIYRAEEKGVSDYEVAEHRHNFLLAFYEAVKGRVDGGVSSLELKRAALEVERKEIVSDRVELAAEVAQAQVGESISPAELGAREVTLNKREQALPVRKAVLDQEEKGLGRCKQFLDAAADEVSSAQERLKAIELYMAQEERRREAMAAKHRAEEVERKRTLNRPAPLEIDPIGDQKITLDESSDSPMLVEVASPEGLSDTPSNSSASMSSASMSELLTPKVGELVLLPEVREDPESLEQAERDRQLKLSVEIAAQEKLAQARAAKAKEEAKQAALKNAREERAAAEKRKEVLRLRDLRRELAKKADRIATTFKVAEHAVALNLPSPLPESKLRPAPKESHNMLVQFLNDAGEYPKEIDCKTPQAFFVSYLLFGGKDGGDIGRVPKEDVACALFIDAVQRCDVDAAAREYKPMQAAITKYKVGDDALVNAATRVGCMQQVKAYRIYQKLAQNPNKFPTALLVDFLLSARNRNDELTYQLTPFLKRFPDSAVLIRCAVLQASAYAHLYSAMAGTPVEVDAGALKRERQHTSGSVADQHAAFIAVHRFLRKKFQGSRDRIGRLDGAMLDVERALGVTRNEQAVNPFPEWHPRQICFETRTDFRMVNHPLRVAARAGYAAVADMYDNPTQEILGAALDAYKATFGDPTQPHEGVLGKWLVQLRGYCADGRQNFEPRDLFWQYAYYRTHKAFDPSWEATTPLHDLLLKNSCFDKAFKSQQLLLDKWYEATRVREYVLDVDQRYGFRPEEKLMILGRSRYLMFEKNRDIVMPRILGVFSLAFNTVALMLSVVPILGPSFFKTLTAVANWLTSTKSGGMTEAFKFKDTPLEKPVGLFFKHAHRPISTPDRPDNLAVPQRVDPMGMV